MSLFPVGHLSLVVGDPGVGKSILAVDLAARVARGEEVLGSGLNVLSEGEMQNAECGMQNDGGEGDSSSEIGALEAPRCGGAESGEGGVGRLVIPERPVGRLAIPGAGGADWPVAMFFSAEDSTETLGERVRAAGGGGGGLRVMTGKRPSMEWVTMEVGLATGPKGRLRMVVLDPLPSFLGKRDSVHGVSIRGAMEGLLDLAREWKFGVVGLSHLTKQGGARRSVYRVMGSLAYAALARAVYLVEAGDEGRRLLMPLKHNLVARPLAREFVLAGGPVIRWGGVVEDVEGWLEPEREMGAQMRLAIEFLDEELKDGPVASAELLSRGRGLGLSPATLCRARELRGVRTIRDGRTGTWRCALGSWGAAEKT